MEETSRPGNGFTILLAEDEDEVRELIAQVLQFSGYAVLTAPDGESALALFQKHKNQIDLILLDLSMPVMGGMAVFEEVRKISQETRILFNSGYDTRTIVQEIDGQDRVFTLQKPYTPTVLLETIGRILQPAE